MSREFIVVRALTKSDMGWFGAHRAQTASKQRALTINAPAIKKLLTEKEIESGRIEVLATCLYSEGEHTEVRRLWKSGRNWRFGGKKLEGDIFSNINQGDIIVLKFEGNRVMFTFILKNTQNYSIIAKLFDDDDVTKELKHTDWRKRGGKQSMPIMEKGDLRYEGLNQLFFLDEPEEIRSIIQWIICEEEDITDEEWSVMSDDDKKWFQDKHAIAIARAIAEAFNFNPTNEEGPKAPIPDVVRAVAERLMEEQREETGTRGKQAKHKTGFIYLVRLPEHPEYVKAGRTVDGDSRLRTYHNAHPLDGHEMVFVGFVNNYKGAEEELLKRLKPYLHKGEEWFKVDIDHAIDVILDIYRSDEFGIPEILALPNMGLKFEDDEDDEEAA